VRNLWLEGTHEVRRRVDDGAVEVEDRLLALAKARWKFRGLRIEPDAQQRILFRPNPTQFVDEHGHR
jgi:hypothetical protein